MKALRTLLAALLLLAWMPAAGVAKNAPRAAPAAPAPAAPTAPATTPAMRLALGKAALEDSLFPVAQEQFEALLAEPDRDPAATHDIVILLARALQAQGKFAPLIELLAQQARKSAGTPREGDATYWLAEACNAAGRTSEALDLLKDFETRFPGNADLSEVLRLRAWCHLRAGDLERAYAAFERYHADFGDRPEAADALLNWAKALLAGDHPDKAAELLRRMVKEHPASPRASEARYWIAQILMQQHDWPAAAAILTQLSTDEAAGRELQSKAWFALAEGHETAGEPARAVEALNHAIELTRDDEARQRGSVLLGQLLLRLGRIDEGVARLKAFIKTFTDRPLAGTLQLKLAQSLMDNGEAARAVDEFQNYLEAFSDETGTPQAHEGKAWALYWSGGRYAEAAAAFEKAYGLFRAPEDRQRALFKVADSFFENAQYALAHEKYEKYLQEFPASEWSGKARFQIGECLVRSGHTNEAEAILIDLVDVARGASNSTIAADALLRLADLKKDQKQLSAAMEYYETVVRRFTNGLARAQAFDGYGLAAYQLYRFGPALQSFQRIVEEYPGEAIAEHASFMAGCCLYMLYRTDDALQLWTRFLAAAPDSRWAPHARFWMAKHHWNVKEFSAAESNFLAVANHYTNSLLAPYALLRAGQAAAEQKDFRRAIEHYTQLAKDYPDNDRLPEARYLQGDALCGLALFSEAILIFDEIIARYPRNPLTILAWRRKGDCQFTLGGSDPKRFTEAIASYRAAIDSPTASLNLILQAEYMTGRCLEQLGRREEAFRQYYKVIIRYFDEQSRGVWHGEDSQLWFTRAAFNAVDLLIADEKWKNAAQILQRIIDADVPDARLARQQLDEMRAKRWWVFY